MEMKNPQIKNKLKQQAKFFGKAGGQLTNFNFTKYFF